MRLRGDPVKRLRKAEVCMYFTRTSSSYKCNGPIDASSTVTLQLFFLSGWMRSYGGVLNHRCKTSMSIRSAILHARLAGIFCYADRS